MLAEFYAKTEKLQELAKKVAQPIEKRARRFGLFDPSLMHSNSKVNSSSQIIIEGRIYQTID